MRNRRQAVRVRCIRELNIALADRETLRVLHKNLTGIIKDISSTGMFFETMNFPKSYISRLKTGEWFFYLTFRLFTKGEPMTVLADVQWIREPGAYLERNRMGWGVSFSKISEHNRRLILNYILDQELSALD